MLLLPRALSQFRLAALALVLLTVVTRLPSLLHPWSIDDEAVYSVVANEIVGCMPEYSKRLASSTLGVCTPLRWGGRWPRWLVFM